MIRALEELYALGALNEKGELTKLGRQMSEFPLDPFMSAAIVAAEKFDCVDQTVTIVAMLSNLSDLYLGSRGRREEETNARKALWSTEGDHLTLLNIWNHVRPPASSHLWRTLIVLMVELNVPSCIVERKQFFERLVPGLFFVQKVSESEPGCP